MRIKDLENRSLREVQTEIFIETPYRNQKLMTALLAVCSSSTLLCVAEDLTLPTETIRTRTIAQWRAQTAPVGRRPAIFLLLANPDR